MDAIAVTKTISTSRDEIREILLALDRLRLILSSLLTPGLNEDVESICFGKLGAYPASVLVGLSRSVQFIPSLCNTAQPIAPVLTLTPRYIIPRIQGIIGVYPEKRPHLGLWQSFLCYVQ